MGIPARAGRGRDCRDGRLERCARRHAGARLGRHVKHVGALGGRKLERADIAGVQSHGRVLGNMRRGFGKVTRIARQQRHLGAEAEIVVRSQETFHHPAAEEPGSARHEQPTSVEVLPEALGVLQDVPKVLLRQRPGATPKHRFGSVPARHRARATAS